MSKLKELLGKKLQRNINLAPYTTTRVGGVAEYFYVAKDLLELVEVLKIVTAENTRYLLLGGGSNTIFRDGVFHGLVIKNLTSNIEVKDKEIIADSGASLGTIFNQAKEHGLGGYENLVGIPGTIGGAVYGNAGAFGAEIKDLVKEVKIFKDGSIEVLNQEQCGFVYRESIFKQHPEWVILQVVLRFVPIEPISESKVKEILSKRAGIYPKYPNPGCMFKNLKGEKFRLVFDQLTVEEKKLLDNKYIDWQVIPVAWLMDNILKLKGTVIGGAKISEEHAAFIVNFNQAVAGDFVGLINLVKDKARERFGVDLEEEVRII